MGQDISSTEFSDKSLENLRNTHDFLSQEHHPIYGNVTYFKDRVTQKKIMMITRNLMEECEIGHFYHFYNEIHPRSKFDHANLLKFAGWRKNMDEKLCGNSGSYDVFLPYIEKTLAFELERRVQNQVNFLKYRKYRKYLIFLFLGVFLRKRIMVFSVFFDKCS